MKGKAMPSSPRPEAPWLLAPGYGARDTSLKLIRYAFELAPIPAIPAVGAIILFALLSLLDLLSLTGVFLIAYIISIPATVCLAIAHRLRLGTLAAFPWATYAMAGSGMGVITAVAVLVAAEGWRAVLPMDVYVLGLMAWCVVTGAVAGLSAGWLWRIPYGNQATLGASGTAAPLWRRR